VECVEEPGCVVEVEPPGRLVLDVAPSEVEVEEEESVDVEVVVLPESMVVVGTPVVGELAVPPSSGLPPPDVKYQASPPPIAPKQKTQAAVTMRILEGILREGVLRGGRPPPERTGRGEAMGGRSAFARSDQ
jgi:hypothetical protein